MRLFEWESGWRYVGVYVMGPFHLGMRHVYYDGPNCQLSLGWLHIGWALWWCTRCFPSPQPDRTDPEKKP